MCRTSPSVEGRGTGGGGQGFRTQGLRRDSTTGCLRSDLVSLRAGGRGMWRPRLKRAGIRLEPGPPSAWTPVCWTPILTRSCDLSFFMRTESFILASSSPQGGRRPPGRRSLTFVQEAGLPTSEGKPGPSQYNHWGSEPTTHLCGGLLPVSGSSKPRSRP